MPWGVNNRAWRVPEEDNVLKELHGQGLIIGDIAAKMGRSKWAVRVHLKKLGLKPNWATPDFWTPDNLKWVIDLYQSGMPWRQISQTTGHSESAMRVRLAQLGVPRNRKSDDIHESGIDYDLRPPEPPPSPRACIGVLCNKKVKFQPEHRHQFMCKPCQKAAASLA